MAFNRNNKVSAEFNMSSLTDIIFLLLIFFMLTSNFVQIEANDLPESDSKTVASTKLIVEVDDDGRFKYNGESRSKKALEGLVGTELAGMSDTEKREVTLTIAATKTTPFNHVADLMEIAEKYKIKAILATQPKS